MDKSQPVQAVSKQAKNVVDKVVDGVMAHLRDENAKELLGPGLAPLLGLGSLRSIVSVALYADVLRVVGDAMEADGMVSDAELEACLKLVSALADHLTKVRKDYGPYSIDSVCKAREFLTQYEADDGLFGYRNETTKWAGVLLCRSVQNACDDARPLETFGDALLRWATRLVAVEGVSPCENASLHLLRLLVKPTRHVMPSARNTRAAEVIATARKRPEGHSVSGVAVALRFLAYPVMPVIVVLAFVCIWVGGRLVDQSRPAAQDREATKSWREAMPQAMEPEQALHVPELMPKPAIKQPTPPLTEEESRKIIAEAKGSVLRIDAGSLSVEAAEVIAAFYKELPDARRATIELVELSTLDAAVARALAESKCILCFRAVKDLTPEVAAIISHHVGDAMEFSNLREASRPTIAALASYNGEVRGRISDDIAKLRERRAKGRLTSERVRGLVQGDGRRSGHLDMEGVTDISAEAAETLVVECASLWRSTSGTDGWGSHHPEFCTVVGPLDSLDARVAGLLARLPGELHVAFASPCDPLAILALAQGNAEHLHIYGPKAFYTNAIQEALSRRPLVRPYIFLRPRPGVQKVSAIQDVDEECHGHTAATLSISMKAELSHDEYRAASTRASPSSWVSSKRQRNLWPYGSASSGLTPADVEVVFPLWRRLNTLVEEVYESAGNHTTPSPAKFLNDKTAYAIVLKGGDGITCSTAGISALKPEEASALVLTYNAGFVRNENVHAASLEPSISHCFGRGYLTNQRGSDSGLLFDWVEKLDVSGLRALDVECAAEIAKALGPVDLSGLSELSVELAEALAQHRGPLRLCGIKAVTPEVAAAIAGHYAYGHQPRRGFCGGLTIGLEELTPDVARALSACRDAICFPRLKSISAKSIKELGAHAFAGTIPPQAPADLIGLLGVPFGKATPEEDKVAIWKHWQEAIAADSNWRQQMVQDARANAGVWDGATAVVVERDQRQKPISLPEWLKETERVQAAARAQALGLSPVQLAERFNLCYSRTDTQKELALLRACGLRLGLAEVDTDTAAAIAQYPYRVAIFHPADLDSDSDLRGVAFGTRALRELSECQGGVVFGKIYRMKDSDVVSLSGYVTPAVVLDVSKRTSAAEWTGYLSCDTLHKLKGANVICNKKMIQEAIESGCHKSGPRPTEGLWARTFRDSEASAGQGDMKAMKLHASMHAKLLAADVTVEDVNWGEAILRNGGHNSPELDTPEQKRRFQKVLEVLAK